MKRNKKGFTIIELVVVIAVIAILAAVLIPTFSSIIKKANISADEQAVYQMNTALSIYTAEHGAPVNGAEVKMALDQNLINTESMIPVTQGYAFYWDNANNKIVLVGPDKETAKDGWVLLTSTGYGELNEVSSTDAISTAINASTIEKPALVRFTSDIEIAKTTTANTANDQSNNSFEYIYNIGKNSTVIFDLNGQTLENNAGYGTGSDGANKNIIAFYVSAGGSLTIKNGTIKGPSKAIEVIDGSVSLSNVKIESTGNSAIRFGGLSDVSIMDSTITSTTEFAFTSNSNADESDGSRVSLVRSTFKTTAPGYAAIYIPTYCDVNISDCTIIGTQHGVYFRGCNATIADSIIYNTNADGQKEGSQWGGGNNGYTADIVFAAGGGGYISTGTYVCENVTGNPDTTDTNSAFIVIVHQLDGAKVSVSGISVGKTFTKTSFADESWESVNS